METGTNDLTYFNGISGNPSNSKLPSLDSVTESVKHTRIVFFSQNKCNEYQRADANLDYDRMLFILAWLIVALEALLQNTEY